MTESNKNFLDMEKKLSEIPAVSTETHFLLNDISEKIVKNQELSQSEDDYLGELWRSLQEEDKNFVLSLVSQQSNGMLSREEVMACVNVLLAAVQLGPNLDNIRRLLIDRSTSLDRFQQALGEVSVPKQSKLLLLQVYEKLIRTQ